MDSCQLNVLVVAQSRLVRCARTALTVINPFDSPLEFTGALHTYFTCADVGKVQVLGFEGLTYENSAAGGAKETQAEKLLGFSGEVDRIYYDTPAELYLLNVGASGRHLKLFKMGFPDAPRAPSRVQVLVVRARTNAPRNRTI